MSKPLRYDSILVRNLARELDAALRSKRIRWIRFDSETLELALGFEDNTLSWPLHPARGEPVLHPAQPAPPRTVKLGRRTYVARVHAPTDERVILIDVSSGAHGRKLARVVIELLTNQWNAIAVDPDGAILTLLVRRTSGERALQPGAKYSPPANVQRRGAETPISRAEWDELVRNENPERSLLDAIAYLSPINIQHALRGYDHYLDLFTSNAFLFDDSLQPYPVLLDGHTAERTTSLLDAFARRASSATTVHSDAVQRALRHVEKRVKSLQRQFADAMPEAARLRRDADLLKAQLHAVKRGASSAELDDFEGGSVKVALDPELSAVRNAESWYEEARKRERAAAKLPRLIEKANAEILRLTEVAERALTGAVDASELAPFVQAKVERARIEPTLPYRSFTTSGGIEVRVGRNRKANDDLTFRHSRPDDVWLHARDAAGAHVVLRWADAQANPPARDLEEAAILAALNSKSRTSKTVPVDWTRRKYVRKPRGAPPGSVSVERVKTIFVQPDPGIVQRLSSE